jgi:hypothetical protein
MVIRSAQHKHAVGLLTMACLPQGRRAKEKLKSAQQQQVQKDTGLLRSDLDASKQREQRLRDQNSGLQHVNQQQKAQLAVLKQRLAQETADGLRQQAEARNVLESQLKRLTELVQQDSDKVCW